MPLKISFHEFSDNKLVFVFPVKAREGELSDDALGDVSGGVSVHPASAAVMGYACFPDYRIKSPDPTVQNSGGLSVK